MADTEIGNSLGVAALSPGSLLASITADGATDNEVVVDTIKYLEIGMIIDILVRATGSATGGATSRTITGITTAAGVPNGAGSVWYSGADVDPDNTFGLYIAGKYTQRYQNLNGGPAEQRGFNIGGDDSIGSLRARLKAINSTTYSDAELQKMTKNDMVWALRQNDALTSIQQ